jgi:ketosteroid isomerase-like protein
MKRNILFGGISLVILTMAIACNQKKELTPAIIDKAQIKAEIQAIENRLADVYNSGNADSLAYYADDAVSYFNNQLPIVGKEAIHQFIVEELENFPDGAKLSYESKEVHISSDGNQVLEIGAYKVVDSTGTKLRSGRYFSLFEKRNGKYVCIRDMGNSDPIEE